MKLLIRAIFPIAILIVGLVAWKWLGQPVEPPKPKLRGQKIIKTEKIVLDLIDYPVLIDTQGTVTAHQTATLTPLVSGTIIDISSSFEDGAFFKKGDILVTLDPADLKTAVFAAESRLARSQAALIQEQARAKQAALNWQDLGYTDEPSPLVMRVPQLREAEANVSASLAEVEQAKRNLDRASVRAPFDGRVKNRLIGLGQAVGATTQLGEIFATDTAEIRLPLAPAQLPFIDLPKDESDTPVEVLLTDALTNPEGPPTHQWNAKIIRTEGTLDPDSRELFAIARIEDPFSLNSDLPQLRIGQPLRAQVSGITLNDVYVIPRTAMRSLNRIFLIDKTDPEKPKIKKTDITPVWSNREIIIVRNDINPGDWLSTTRLPYAPNGAPVEIITPPPAEEVAAPGEESSNKKSKKYGG